MAKELKRVTCDRTCGFLVESTDSLEIIEFMKAHFRRMHEMRLSEKEIKQKMKSI